MGRREVSGARGHLRCGRRARHPFPAPGLQSWLPLALRPAVYMMRTGGPGLSARKAFSKPFLQPTRLGAGPCGRPGPMRALRQRPEKPPAGTRATPAPAGRYHTAHPSGSPERYRPRPLIGQRGPEAGLPEPGSARQSPLAALRAGPEAGAMVRSGCGVRAGWTPRFGPGFGPGFGPEPWPELGPAVGVGPVDAMAALALTPGFLSRCCCTCCSSTRSATRCWR